MAQKTYIGRKGQDIDVASITASGSLTVTGDVVMVGEAVAAAGATLTVTAALHAGRVVAFGKTSGTICTLPLATGTGNRYTFVIATAATSNANIIQVAQAADVMDGSLNIQADTDSDGTLACWMAEVGDNMMSFAGAAGSGGIVGGHITCIDYADGFWSCQAHTISGGGAEATCFTAGVS